MSDPMGDWRVLCRTRMRAESTSTTGRLKRLTAVKPWEGRRSGGECRRRRTALSGLLRAGRSTGPDRLRGKRTA